MNFNFEDTKNKVVEFFQKYWIPIVGSVIIIAVIISCVNMYREIVLDIDESIEYVNQDTIYIPASSIDTLNPITAITEDSYYINKLMYDSLFEYDNNLGVVPVLVDKYTVNTEKAYIDITLKSGIKFHDGKTLKAQDIRYTVDAILSHGSNGLHYKKASKIYSVSVDGDYELRIYFKNNYECSLDVLTFPIVSSSQYNSIGSFLDDENFMPVGTGEYMVSSYDSYKDLVLVPNKTYAGIVPTKNVVVQIIPDKNNLANLIENETITCYLEKGSDRKTMVVDNNLKMYDIVSNEVEFMYFNTSSTLFKKQEMRKAVAYAIDSQGVLEKGYMNDGVLTDTIYYPNFLGIADTGNNYSYDEEQAKTLLNKQGYEDKDKDGKLEDKKNNALSVTILVNSNNANRIAASKVISTNLENVGFNVTVNAVPWDEYQKQIKSKSFDILITGFTIEESYDLRTFFNGKSLWGYKNDKLYTKVQNLDRLYTSEEYQKIYGELKEMLLDELPYYPLCYKKMGLIGTETLEASSLPMFNDIYKNIGTWEWTKVIEKETANNKA